MMMMVRRLNPRSNLDKVLNDQSTCGWTCVCATYVLTPGLSSKPLTYISLVCIRIGSTLTLELPRESISLLFLLWRHLMLSSTWRATLLQDHQTGKTDQSIFFSDFRDDVKAKLTEVLVIGWRCKGVELWLHTFLGTGLFQFLLKLRAATRWRTWKTLYKSRMEPWLREETWVPKFHLSRYHQCSKRL